MQELTVEFQRAIADFGGSIVNVLADDRGTIGLAAWGGADDSVDSEEMIGIGLLVGFISLGVVTIPLALRELQARRRA